ACTFFADQREERGHFGAVVHAGEGLAERHEERLAFGAGFFLHGVGEGLPRGGVVGAGGQHFGGGGGECSVGNDGIDRTIDDADVILHVLEEDEVGANGVPEGFA